MRAFVTGATGFIGGRLVDRLLKDGHDVIALVRTREDNLPDKVKIVKGDITDSSTFQSFMKGCDRLYHLAAKITFDTRQLDELLRINGAGTGEVLKAAAQAQVKRSVVVSSACALGLSYSEDHVLDEQAGLDEKLASKNPYMASKIEAEREAVKAAKEMEVTIVNPTTVYGAGDRTLNSGAMIKQVANSRIIPAPPGGSNVVDVDDVVEGIIAAGERGRSGSRYTLGGENLLFTDIIKTIGGVVEHSPVIVPVPGFLRVPMAFSAGVFGRLTGSRFITPQIIGDMFAYKYYSSEGAEQELGWRAKRSFKESVAMAWRFYKDNGLA
ncbi:UDP-glucose 4-epimerase [hydrothermal vent metagenome]|uniref:UDP-glucose 4-epimerase n=1 Tax=hydrothermal vent metagenome TaxID=652676 RepID=A0A3B1BV32_9ZZZZ